MNAGWISISDTTLNDCWEHLCPHSVLHGEMRRHMVTVETLHARNCAAAWNQTTRRALRTLTVVYLRHNRSQACGFAACTQECIPKVPSAFSRLSPSSSHSRCSFPSLTPISAAPPYSEVMMRNGVIMPVVKPQATQQMCFRDPAFVSEWIRSLLW